MVAADCACIACLSILLCLSKLSDNWDAEELLSGKLDCEWNGFFLSELNVADTEGLVSNFLGKDG